MFDFLRIFYKICAINLHRCQALGYLTLRWVLSLNIILT
ncbi:hypothetical protein CAMRE0001_0096 [Campylobacter rectus RM3267]|uniref:Uncharacterized protein n=1 Tax=Campylobacter rectus RM3267 TaxID=553218 RepID=B9CXN9_CAMRE|nr:hypothetical protein CAMRE0001_0096 [Campylobacter rectus RM3267]